MPDMPEFFNVKMPDLVYDEYAQECPDQSTDMLLYFIESSEGGLKFSFNYSAQRRAYIVAITLSGRGNDGKNVCATFWSDDLWQALANAYIVCYHFKADKFGFQVAQDAMELRDRAVKEDLRKWRKSKQG